MDQTQTEVKAEEKKGEAAPAVQSPATDKAQDNTGASAIKAALSEGSKPQEQKPKTAADFVRERQEKRENKISDLEKRLAEMEKRLAANASTSVESASDDSGDGLDDIDALANPRKFAADVENRAVQKALAEIEGRKKSADLESRANAATDWLLTRSHLKQDPSFTEAVGKVIAAKYLGVAREAPEVAAQQAYLEVCRTKGVIPDMDVFKPGGSFDAQGGSASGGIRPSGAPVGGGKVFKKGTTQAYIYEAAPGSPEFNRRLAEVEQAYQEGRVK